MLWIDKTSLIKNLIIKSLKFASTACWGDVFIHHKCPHSNLTRASFLYLAHLFLEMLLTNQKNRPINAKLEANTETFADKTRTHRKQENKKAVCKFDFSGKLSYSSAKQTHCRVSATRSGWQLISVFGLVLNERHSGGIELIVGVLMGGRRARDPSRPDSC